MLVSKHTRTRVVAEEIEFSDNVPTAGHERSAAEPAHLSSSSVSSGVTRRRVLATLVLAAALTVAAVVSVRLWRARQTERSSAAPFQRMRLGTLTTNGKALRAAISPDGNYVVNVFKDGARESLWLRQISATRNIEVVAPAEVHYQGVTFSPTGDSVYYVAYAQGNRTGVLYHVPVLGGTPIKVLDDLDSAVAFSPDSKRIAFVRNAPDGKESSLMLSNVDGTAERRLTTRSAPDFFSVEGAAWSPDGARIACAVGRTGFNRTTMGVEEVGVEDGAVRMLTRHQWNFIGQVAWLGDGSAIVMDAWDSAVSLLSRQIWQLPAGDGEARRVTNDLNGYHGVSVTARGDALVTVRASRATNLWVAPGDEPNHAARITSGAGDLVGEVMGMAWTPDGRIVYGSNASGDLDIWIMDADGTHQKQLTAEPQPDLRPTVSPDGRFVVFVSWRTGASHIWRMETDGSNVRQLTNGTAETYPDISPDGRWMVYLSADENSSSMWKVSTDGGEASRLSDAWSLSPTISPDGRLIASFYEDAQSATAKLALIPSEGGKPARLFDLPSTVFLRAGVHWTADGRALAYVDERDGASNIWSQPVDGSPPKPLTNFTSDKIFRFAWSRDGKRLAFERGAEINDVTLIGDFK
jgi:Tol biopolymer transport system component